MEIRTGDYECLLVEGNSEGRVLIGAWRDAPGNDFDGRHVELNKAQTLELIAELQRRDDAEEDSRREDEAVSA